MKLPMSLLNLVLLGLSTSAMALETDLSQNQFFAGVSVANNRYPIQSVSNETLTDDSPRRFDLGVNYRLSPQWRLGAIVSLQAQTRSAFHEGFVIPSLTLSDQASLALRMGIRNHFVGSSNGISNSSVSDTSFAGMLSPTLNVALGSGFSFVTSSLSGQSPFDGLASWDIRSSGYFTYGLPMGIQKEFGSAGALLVRSGYHRLVGGGSASGNFIPVRVEGKLQVNRDIALGASYEMPGNTTDPDFSAAGEYYLYERNATLWATKQL